MLREIPTHLIGGPLGAGKTSLIRSLLAQKPAGERWAVLVNEFGEIGLDAALLATDVDGVAIGEVAGGCLCCVNGVPFQVGLGRLLRRARPDRLFIEPSGLGHPLALWKQLQAPPWSGVLALQPLVVVLDAAALASGQPLPEAQEQALEAAGMLLLNKSEALDATQRCAVRARLPVLPLRWSVRGHLALRDLPTSVAGKVARRPGRPCRRRLLSWERCCPPSDRCAPCASRTASSPSAGGWRRRCVSIGSQWTPG
ncbi:G3E family GTPase [Pseudomonas aeruginosa]|nr:G3E family GTPase [Pseudomonas aeruginosa]